MRYQHSPIVRSIWLFFAAMVCGAIGANAQDNAIKLSASADGPTIIAGEPLFVTVKLLNSSTAPKLWRIDGDGLRRTIIAPDGTRTERDPPEMTGDGGFFSREVKPGSEDAIRFVAAETVQLTQSGAYKMTVEYPPLHASGELWFTVKPYDLSALRVRAEQMRDLARSSNEEGGLNQVALTALDPGVSKLLLCDILKQDRMAILAPRRMEEIGDADSVGCLIEVLPVTRGNQRAVVIGALRRLELGTTDGDLVKKIQKALSTATP
jgi:hypothetical protein